MHSVKSLEREFKQFIRHYQHLIKQSSTTLTGGDINRLVRVVTSSTSDLVQGLEGILRTISKIGDAHHFKEFYRDDKCRFYRLDESKLPNLNEEEKATVSFIAKNRINKQTGETYYHSALYREVRAFLFDYWKEKDQEKLMEIVSKTTALKYNSNVYLGLSKRLELKDIQHISLDDLEPSEYRSYFSYYGIKTPFREACKSAIDSLRNKGVLQFTTEGKVYISVNPEYLTP